MHVHIVYLHVYDIASFPVLPRTRFTFTCDNCGGEHFETGKAWSETSREVDVGRRQVGVARLGMRSTGCTVYTDLELL